MFIQLIPLEVPLTGATGAAPTVIQASSEP